MGELESAVRWMESSLERISGRERRLHLPKLQIQMAVLRAQQGRMSEAEQLFRQGIDGADAAGDLELHALGCNRMGEAFLLRGELTRAEPALLEAFRVRRLHHLPLDTSYHRLGRLRLAQGDLASASNLLDRAVELAVRAQNQMPMWDIYYSRGLVRLQQGRLRGALGDLRIAVRLANAWRGSAPSAETARISAETKLDQVPRSSKPLAGSIWSPAIGRWSVRRSPPPKKTAPLVCDPCSPPATPGRTLHRPTGKHWPRSSVPKRPLFAAPPPPRARRSGAPAPNGRARRHPRSRAMGTLPPNRPAIWRRVRWRRWGPIRRSSASI